MCFWKSPYPQCIQTCDWFLLLQQLEHEIILAVKINLAVGVICLFVCLFICLGFFFPLKIFHSYGDVTISGDELQSFDFCSALMAFEQWGFFSVPHLHGASVYNMVNSEDPWHSQPLPSVKQWGFHYLFLRLLGLALMEFEQQTFRLLGDNSNRLHHHRA